ncbi:MAG: MBL fold metallo-hydrolase [Lachnospiraceae bacterium]
MEQILQAEGGRIRREQVLDHLIRFSEMGTYFPGHPLSPMVDSWLYLGSERAVLIDCLQSVQGFLPIVRRETDLPLTVLLTHGHPDHAGRSTQEFLEAGIPVFLDPRDCDILERGIDRERILPLREGQSFPLGDRSVTAWSCPGHTPGSMIFTDAASGIAFTGDAIGSGTIWLFLPTSLPLGICRESFAGTRDLFVRENIRTICPGHLVQAMRPLSLHYLEDLITCTDRVLAGAGKDLPVRHIRLWREKLAFCETSCGEVQQFWFDPARAVCEVFPIEMYTKIQ